MIGLFTPKKIVRFLLFRKYLLRVVSFSYQNLLKNSFIFSNFLSGALKCGKYYRQAIRWDFPGWYCQAKLTDATISDVYSVNWSNIFPRAKAFCIFFCSGLTLAYIRTPFGPKSLQGTQKGSNSIKKRGSLQKKDLNWLLPVQDKMTSRVSEKQSESDQDNIYNFVMSLRDS